MRGALKNSFVTRLDNAVGLIVDFFLNMRADTREK